MSEQKTPLSIVCITHLTTTISWTPIAQKLVPVYIEQWIQHTIVYGATSLPESEHSQSLDMRKLLTMQRCWLSKLRISNRLGLEYGNLPSTSSLDSFCLNSSAAFFAFLGSSRSNFNQTTSPFPGPSLSSFSCAIALVALRKVSGQARGVYSSIAYPSAISSL